MKVDKTIENKLNFELKVAVAAKRFFFSRNNLVAYSKTAYSKRKYLVRSLDKSILIEIVVDENYFITNLL